MRNFILFSMALMLLLVLTKGYCEQKSQWEPVDWTVIYTADTMPEVANPPWEASEPYDRTIAYTSVQGGIATVDTLSSDANVDEGWLIPWKASATAGQVIEVRLKVYKGSEGAGQMMSLQDGTYKVSIIFMPNYISMGTADGTLKHSMDTTDDFHTYRIIHYGKEVKVYVDGKAESVLSGEAAYVPLIWKHLNRIFWGDGTSSNDGRSDWDYIKFSPAVAYDSKGKKDSSSQEIKHGRGLVRQGGVEVEAIDYSEKTIYHSPETPGWTSWVGLWQLPDGRIRCTFRQQTGPKDKMKVEAPLLESLDGGETWKRLEDLSGFTYSAMAVLSDGTFVRADSNGVRRSENGGKTWSKLVYPLPPESYIGGASWVRELKDDRLVLMAAYCKRDDAAAAKLKTFPSSGMRKMMSISSDKGKTWGKLIELMSLEDGACEESDFCELPNGDLFWVHRCEVFPSKMTKIPPGAARMGSDPANPWTWAYSDRKQSITRKKGNTFVPEKPELMPVPHSGHPMVLYTQEGIILNFQRDGIYWTADLGKRWEKLKVYGKHWEKLKIYMPSPFHQRRTWYPRALQLADGKIICIAHVGGDDVYGTVDQAIFQQTFRLKVVR